MAALRALLLDEVRRVPLAEQGRRQFHPLAEPSSAPNTSGRGASGCAEE
jgi:hypothetical protein